MRRIAWWLPLVPCATGACNLLVHAFDPVADVGDESPIDSSTASQDASGDAVDAGADGARDAAADGSVPPELVCRTDANSLVRVADTSTLGDAGALGFVHKVWITKTTAHNQIFVYTQLAGSTSFLEYPVDFSAGGSPRGQAYTGFSNRGIGLLDVSTTIAGGTVTNVALATYPSPVVGAVPAFGLQLVPLAPSFTGYIPSNAFAVAVPVAGHVTSGVFLHPTPTSAEWVVSGQSTMSQRYTVSVGAGSQSDASGPWLTLAASPTSGYSVDNTPLFDMAGSLYAIVSGAGPSGATTVFRWPDDWSGDASAAPVSAQVLAARPSASEPSTALVLMAVPDSTPTQERIYGARVPPSQLTSLTAGAPPFVSGSLLEATELPSASVGLGWLDDETAIVGPTQGGAGLQLVWLGPDGRAISHPATSGLLQPAGDQVSASAVQFDSQLGESAATLFVAWIESSATGVQRLYAAKVLCGIARDSG